MRKILDDKLAFIMVIFLFTLAFTLNAMHGAGTSVGHTPLALPDVTLVAHGPTIPPDPWDGVSIAHGPTIPPDPWDGVRIAHGPTIPPDPWDGVRIAHGPTIPPDPWDGARSMA